MYLERDQYKHTHIYLVKFKKKKMESHKYYGGFEEQGMSWMLRVRAC